MKRIRTTAHSHYIVNKISYESSVSFIISIECGVSVKNSSWLTKHNALTERHTFAFVSVCTHVCAFMWQMEGNFSVAPEVMTTSLPSPSQTGPLILQLK